MTGRLLLAAALAVFVALGGFVHAAEPPVAGEIELKENVQYGETDGEKLTLHLATPKDLSELSPVIVYIHGGGWRAGNKDGHIAQIQEAAKRGYVSVSVGYRFAPKYPFPAQVEDVKCAVRWLRAKKDELKIDPDRIGAIGYSAGAHLSMMLGTMDSSDGLEGNGGWNDQSSKVQCVVAYFGPTNFLSPYPEVTQPIIEQFLGGKLADKEDNYRKASPITYVNEGDAPTLIFQGTKDILVPYEQAFEMTTALTKANVPGRVELLLGAGHGWKEEDMRQTQNLALAFFDKYLKK